MSSSKGRSLAIPLARRVVGDFLEVSKSVPTVPFEKSMDVSAVAEARQVILGDPPSWCSIFTKAYAKVVAAHPELRRAYLSLPWERFFEYESTTADIVIETPYQGDPALVGLMLKRADTQSLQEIDRLLNVCRQEPLDRSARFRRMQRLAYFPRILRRWVTWYVLNSSGRMRARYLGTFGVSSVANWGVDSLAPRSLWTTLLHYGTVNSQGSVAVRLTFDHRVMDGSTPAKALVELERVLQTDIVAELKELQGAALKVA